MDFAFIAAGVTGALEWTMAAGAVASLLRGGDVARRADPGTGCSTTGCIPIRVRRRYRRERLLFLEADGVLLCPNRGNAQARANARRRTARLRLWQSIRSTFPPPSRNRADREQPANHLQYVPPTNLNPVTNRHNRRHRQTPGQTAEKQTTNTVVRVSESSETDNRYRRRHVATYLS